MLVGIFIMLVIIHCVQMAVAINMFFDSNNGNHINYRGTYPDTSGKMNIRTFLRGMIPFWWLVMFVRWSTKGIIDTFSKADW